MAVGVAEERNPGICHNNCTCKPVLGGHHPRGAGPVGWHPTGFWATLKGDPAAAKGFDWILSTSNGFVNLGRQPTRPDFPEGDAVPHERRLRPSKNVLPSVWGAIDAPNRKNFCAGCVQESVVAQRCEIAAHLGQGISCTPGSVREQAFSYNIRYRRSKFVSCTRAKHNPVQWCRRGPPSLPGA